MDGNHVGPDRDGKMIRTFDTTNCPLTMHCYWRNGSPESRPNALEAVLAPTIWVHFPSPRKKMSNPCRDWILILREVNSCNHQPDAATDLPQ